jgi:hypothetical protein
LNPDSKSFYELNNPKFVSEIGISHGLWEETAVFCHEVAAFNYDFTYHLNEAELKGFKGQMPEKLKIPN